ncbi:MAG: hypothetical protein ABI810_09040 [Sphingomonas bacterium]
MTVSLVPARKNVRQGDARHGFPECGDLLHHLFDFGSAPINDGDELRNRLTMARDRKALTARNVTQQLRQMGFGFRALHGAHRWLSIGQYDQSKLSEAACNRKRSRGSDAGDSTLCSIMSASSS